MNLEELKRLLAEATKGPWETRPYAIDRNHPDNPLNRWKISTQKSVLGSFEETDARLIVAAVNALPELIAIAERMRVAEGDILFVAYAAGRADQRKADVEIARQLKAWSEAGRQHTKDPWEIDRADAKAQAAESIAKAIEEQFDAPQNA